MGLFWWRAKSEFLAQIKGIIVTEGAFSSISIQQALNKAYGGVSRNPWRVIACSGSGATDFQKQALKELKDKGFKVVIAPDTDEAGMKMYQKFVDSSAATHYAFTNDTEKDWNDVLKDIGMEEFAKFVIKSITPIDVK